MTSSNKFEHLINASKCLSDSVSSAVKFAGTDVRLNQMDELGLMSNLAHDLIHDAGAIRTILGLLDISPDTPNRNKKVLDISTAAIKSLNDRLSTDNMAGRMRDHNVAQFSEEGLDIIRECCARGKEVALQLQKLSPEKKVELGVIAKALEEKELRSYSLPSQNR